MSDTRVTAALLRNGTPLPAGPTVPLDPTGLVIALDIPPGVTLSRAALTVEAPGDDVTLDLAEGPPPAAIATDLGAGRPPANKNCGWITLDWSARRPLTFVRIEPVKGAAASKGTATKARLKVSEGGPWFSPLPAGTEPDTPIALGAAGQQLPGIAASRLLIELDPPVRVKAVSARAPARPADLSASIEPDAPFFQCATPMEPQAALEIRDPLTDALRRAWPRDLGAGTLHVTLRSSAAGQLRKLTLTLATALVVRAFRDGPELRLPLPTAIEAIARIDVPDLPLDAVELAVLHALRPERPALAPEILTEPARAHRAAPDLAAAQAFTLSAPAALAGVDLYLRPLTRQIKATLAIHADAWGRPADDPIADAVASVEIDEPGDAPWHPRWTPTDLPNPPALPQGVFWAVLELTEGAVLWYLDTIPSDSPGEIAPAAALYRERTGPWTAREGAWALTRPRLSEPAAPPPPRLQLRRGPAAIDAPIDPAGRVALTATELAPLRPTGAGTPAPLEIAVRSQAPGEVTLADLRVQLPRAESIDLFVPH